MMRPTGAGTNSRDWQGRRARMASRRTGSAVDLRVRWRAGTSTTEARGSLTFWAWADSGAVMPRQQSASVATNEDDPLFLQAERGARAVSANPSKLHDAQEEQGEYGGEGGGGEVDEVVAEDAAALDGGSEEAIEEEAGGGGGEGDGESSGARGACSSRR